MYLQWYPPWSSIPECGVDENMPDRRRRPFPVVLTGAVVYTHGRTGKESGAFPVRERAAASVMDQQLPKTAEEVNRRWLGWIEQFSKTDKQGKQERYLSLNRLAKKGQILFAGSSLMEQFPVCELLTSLSMPYTVYNRGISGATTEEYREFLLRCAEELQPRKLFVNIGSNDLNQTSYDAGAQTEMLRQLFADIRAKAPGVCLYFIAWYPVCEEIPAMVMTDGVTARTNEMVNAANVRLKELCGEEGVTCLDVNDALRDETGGLKRQYAADRMHMLPEAYVEILKKLAPYLAD